MDDPYNPVPPGTLGTQQQKERESKKEPAEVPSAGGSAMQTQEEPVQIIIEPDEKRRTPYNLQE